MIHAVILAVAAAMITISGYGYRSLLQFSASAEIIVSLEDLEDVTEEIVGFYLSS